MAIRVDPPIAGDLSKRIFPYGNSILRKDYQSFIRQLKRLAVLFLLTTKLRGTSMIPTDNPSYLRGRAAAARSMLSGCMDGTIRNALREIADSYELMAQQAEVLKKVARPALMPLCLWAAFEYLADLPLVLAA